MPVTHGVTGSSPVRTAEERGEWVCVKPSGLRLLILFLCPCPKLPRPGLIAKKLFRLAHLSENLGYGLRKLKRWQEVTGRPIHIETTINSVKVTFDLQTRKAEKSDVATKTIERELAALSDIVHYVGSKKGGHWEMISNEEANSMDYKCFINLIIAAYPNVTLTYLSRIRK